MTPERAAELTAMCEEVSSEWRQPEHKRWKAIRWCKALGERIAGEGPTALAAVLDADRRVRTENGYSRKI